MFKCFDSIFSHACLKRKKEKPLPIYLLHYVCASCVECQSSREVKKIAMVSNNTGILNFNILKLNEMKGSRSGRDREGKNDWQIKFVMSFTSFMGFKREESFKASCKVEWWDECVMLQLYFWKWLFRGIAGSSQQSGVE